METGKVLVPAYGRVYRSRTTVLEAFHEGRDFYAMDIYRQGYTSKRELQELANETGDTICITFRYGARLNKCTTLTMKPEY